METENTDSREANASLTTSLVYHLARELSGGGEPSPECIMGVVRLFKLAPEQEDEPLSEEFTAYLEGLRQDFDRRV